MQSTIGSNVTVSTASLRFGAGSEDRHDQIYQQATKAFAVCRIKTVLAIMPYDGFRAGCTTSTGSGVALASAFLLSCNGSFRPGCFLAASSSTACVADLAREGRRGAGPGSCRG